MKILWILLGFVAYLNIGYFLGRLSWMIYQKFFPCRTYSYRKGTSPRWEKFKWLLFILWPASTYWEDDETCIQFYDRDREKKEYYNEMAFFWPLKLIWNIPVGLMVVIVWGAKYIAKKGKDFKVVGFIVGLATLPMRKILHLNNS